MTRRIHIIGYESIRNVEAVLSVTRLKSSYVLTTVRATRPQLVQPRAKKSSGRSIADRMR
jgi:hypothetical protein